MNKELLQLTPEKYKKIQRDYYEQLFANKMNNLEEIHGQSRRSQEETDNLNRLITRNEIEPEIKKKKSPSKQQSRTRQSHRGILPNI